MLIVNAGPKMTVSHIVQGEYGYYFMWDKLRYRIHHYWLCRFRYLNEANELQSKHLLALKPVDPYHFNK